MAAMELPSFSVLLAVLAAAVAGSVHCVGMCGGLMLTATGTRLRSQFIYHGFRLLGYLSMGALAGLAGENLFTDWQWLPLQVFFASVVMILLLLTGLNYLLQWKLPSRFSQFGIGLGYRIGRSDESLVRPALIGFFTVFLPCGWLYSFVLLSLATHSFVGGALTLTVFWLGTLPALLGSRILLQGLFARIGVRGTRVVSAIMIIAALTSLVAHLRSGTQRASASAIDGSAAPAHCN
jgi:sulfite exporter TauE/SafE